MDPLVNTLVIVKYLPGTYSEPDYWHLPDLTALHALYELLGEGSQAFAFHQMYFGDPTDHAHNEQWHTWFAAQWARTFADSQAEVLIEADRCRTFHGSLPSGLTTTDNLFGRQARNGTTATPLRLFCEEYWRADLDDPNRTRQVCQGIIQYFTNDFDVLMLNPSWTHFDDRVAVWARRSGMRSNVYRQIVGLEGWNGREWVVGDIAPLADSTDN